MIKRYFPQGIVTDQDFCNREKERAELAASITSGEHVVLMAPRRYGKSSLITQVLKENQFIGLRIDFFFVLTQEDVMKNIAAGVSKVISMLLPKTKTAATKAVHQIMSLNPKLTFNLFGQKLEISATQTVGNSISELLLTLDQFAKEAGQTCVMVFDEFQQIGDLKENHAVEASIRHAVEQSECVSYIFCGSKRHILSEMFNDKSRPLYHLCDLMTIDRIHSESYFIFLDQLAKNRWHASLSDNTLREIVQLTENHPYYLSGLCRRLWRMNSLPTEKDVKKLWHEYVNQEGVWISNDLSNLTLNRRKLLTALAYRATQEPHGIEFYENVGLNASLVQRALADLQKLDLVYKTPEGYYELLDPAMAYFIRQGARH